MNKNSNTVYKKSQETQELEGKHSLRLKLPKYVPSYNKLTDLDAVNRLQDVTQDIQDLKSMVPGRGYEYRQKLIESDPEMKAADRLAESYRNDDHVLAMLRESAEIQSSVRSQRTKCCMRICLGVSLLGLSVPVGNALSHLISSKWGGQGGSSPR
ncbi:MAG: hypothetical protein IKG87_14850 [Clostridia bacterium]|nr:hypothetical protein [Clostridia bacterium]